MYKTPSTPSNMYNGPFLSGPFNESMPYGVNTGKLQPYPVNYTGLNANSNPQDIANAYHGFVSSSGGNTAANRQKAQSYLANLGVNPNTVNQAYDLYRNASFTQPKPTPYQQFGEGFLDRPDYNNNIVDYIQGKVLGPQGGSPEYGQFIRDLLNYHDSARPAPGTNVADRPVPLRYQNQYVTPTLATRPVTQPRQAPPEAFNRSAPRYQPPQRDNFRSNQRYGNRKDPRIMADYLARLLYL